MPSAPHGTSSPQKAPRTRLVSWKEIADYLDKGERTVKRWAVERALPVHHVPGGGHGSVYALTEELDRWLLSERGNGPAAVFDAEDVPLEVAAVKFATETSREHEQPASSIWKGIGRWKRGAVLVVVTVVAILTASRIVRPDATHAYTSFLRAWLAPVKSPSGSGTPDVEKQVAHDLYLRGRFEWNRRTPESLNRALDFFTQAVVHDPTYAEAYVGLADTYNLLREYTLMPESEAYDRAIAAARKAIELDDSLAEAHRSLAFDEVWGNWDFAAGEKEFRRAIELNPQDPVTHLWFANAFSAPQWYAECLREIDRAQELDPASHAILADKGLMLFHAGMIRQGVDLERQVELADPDFLSPHRYLASMYMALGDYPRFLWETEKAAELTQDKVLKTTTAAARAGFRKEGERGLFRELYLSQKELYEQGKLAGTFLAMTCARMGRKQEALELLEREYEKHSATFLMLKDNPDLVLLKDEPGYQELLRKIHIPAPDSGMPTHPAPQN
jgi:tetratricopeptide (TPR) repeat protein